MSDRTVNQQISDVTAAQISAVMSAIGRRGAGCKRRNSPAVIEKKRAALFVWRAKRLEMLGAKRAAKVESVEVTAEGRVVE